MFLTQINFHLESNIMSAIVKLSASALCFFIASKLEASSVAAKQAAASRAAAEQKQAVAQQKVNQAINLINDTKMFHLDSSKMANLNNAKTIIEQVYNAVK